MTGVEELLRFTDIEKILKEKYEGNRYWFTNSPKEVETLLDIFSSRNIPFLPEISKDDESLSFNCSFKVYRQYRYFPSIAHSHINFEIYYVLNGSGQFISNGSEVTVSQGDLILVAPGTIHSLLINQDDAVIINLLVSVSKFEDVILKNLSDEQMLLRTCTYAFKTNKKAGHLIFRFEKESELTEKILKIFNEWIKEQAYKRKMLDLLLTTFFIDLLREYEKEVVIPVIKNKKTDEIIIDILNTIEMDYVDLSLDKLASSFNYSTRQMSRIIKDYTGKTFMSLVGELRLKRALQLLKQKDLSIDEVAIKTGFSEVSHFYHAFTKCMGCTPKQYREK